MKMVEHEKLVRQQHVDVKTAMVQALWLDLISSAKMLRFALDIGLTVRLDCKIRLKGGP
jgi:hypothetical protein